MPHRVVDKITGMLSGGIAGILLNISLIEVISDAAVKLVVTVMVGIFGGIAGLLGKDIYTRYIKDFINKKK